MPKKHLKTAAILFSAMSILLAGASVSGAEGEPPAAKPAAAADDLKHDFGPLEKLSLGTDVETYGRDLNSPLLLFAAAQIFDDVSPRKSLVEKTTVESDSSVPAPAESKPADGSPRLAQSAKTDSLYRDALNLSREKSYGEIAKFIENITRLSGRKRQSVYGFTEYYDSVRPGNTDVYVISFRGGEEAQVFLSVVGSNLVEFTIVDDGGNPVLTPASLDSPVAASNVSYKWKPTVSRNYTLKVRNLEDRPVEYTLYTN
ncbi:MAG: hypothetical protein LBF41_09025 [Deltaproteobacteria bacterium]|jgi:hypothetical protein|nr:hypothetical protein [Deltaproteobacteria bacterium]